VDATFWRCGCSALPRLLQRLGKKIAVLTAFLGWTFWGRLVLMIWACRSWETIKLLDVPSAPGMPGSRYHH
jgi:hypothetical protein